MSIKKQIQKTVVKAKLTGRISKKFNKAFSKAIKDRIYLKSSEIFDPYTGPAYKKAMEEQLTIDETEFRTWAAALGEVKKEVDEIFKTI